MRPQPGRGSPLREIRTRLERLEGGFGGSGPGRRASQNWFYNLGASDRRNGQTD